MDYWKKIIIILAFISIISLMSFIGYKYITSKDKGVVEKKETKVEKEKGNIVMQNGLKNIVYYDKIDISGYIDSNVDNARIKIYIDGIEYTNKVDLKYNNNTKVFSFSIDVKTLAVGEHILKIKLLANSDDTLLSTHKNKFKVEKVEKSNIQQNEDYGVEKFESNLRGKSQAKNNFSKKSEQQQSSEAIRVVIVDDDDENKEELKDKILGVEFDLNNSTSKGIRIYDAKGLDNDYVVVDDFVKNNGKNDFDDLYPFSGIRRCNLTVDSSNNRSIVYEGEEGFKLDGSNGNVMVEIPKFYFNRERIDNKEKWMISGKKHSGFEVAPLFLGPDGKELDVAYVAAYDIANNASTTFGNVLSRSGADVLKGIKFTRYREISSNAHVGLFDYATLSTIQMLWVIEFADRDVKPYMQGISHLPYFSSSNEAIIGYGETLKQVVIPYKSRVKFFRKGHKVILVLANNKTVKSTYIDDITVTRDGENEVATFTLRDEVNLADIDSGTKYYIAGCPQDTGLSDTVGHNYHTGRVSTENNLSPFRYRYIENLWGNAFNLVEGIRIKSLHYYFTFDKTKYADDDISNWDTVSYTAPEQPYLGDDTYNRAWIKDAGYDSKYKSVILPVSAIVPFSTIPTIGYNAVNQFYSAAIYTKFMHERNGRSAEIEITDPESKIYLCTNGGAFDHGILSSPFTMRFWFLPGTEASTLHTTRIVVR